MPLHASLTDLAEQAPRCESLPAARGVLAEAQELLRNAAQHREDELALAAWFSRIVSDVIHSPAVDSSVRLSGAAARGDALPSIPVAFLGEDESLVELLESVGLSACPEDSTSRRVDAGYPVGAGGEQQLFTEALEQRPPALQLIDGLPDRNTSVSIQATLLSPIAAIARWAAPSPRPTPDRLAIAAERELLTKSEAEELTRAWETGMRLELRRWIDHVHDHPVLLADMPPLDRTAYGEACRCVAEVFTAIVARDTNV